MRVAVVGYSGRVDKPPVSEVAEVSRELGKKLAENGHVVITGGRDGVMELVSEAAKEAGGTVVGVLPGREGEGYVNPYVDVPIYTSMDFHMRSHILIHSAEAVVSIGGEIGTAIEILLSYASGKKLILLRGTGGWTDRFADVLIDGKYLDNRKVVEISQAHNVDEVIEILRG